MTPNVGRRRLLASRVSPRLAVFVATCLALTWYSHHRAAARCANSGSTGAKLLPGAGTAGLDSSGGLQGQAMQGPEAAWDRSPLFKQIDKDLAPFADGISLEMVEQAVCCSNHGGFRIQIIGGQAWILSDRPSMDTRSRFVKLQIQQMLAKGWPIPDVDAFVDLYDRPELPRGPEHPCGHPAQGPVLTMGKGDEHTHGVLIPDWSFGGWWEVGTPGWSDAIGMMLQASQRHPWEQKTPKLFFRGGQTSDGRGRLFRSELIQESELMDIKRAHPYEKGRLDYETLSDHCQYKYLLHMGGHTYSNRLKWLMLCNSTVIVPRDKWYEFYYAALLRDGVNVVMTPPVNGSESTIGAVVEAVRRLEADPEAARRIAAAGAQTMLRELSPDIVLRYWHQVFSRYAALQTFKPQRSMQAWPNNTQSLGHSLAWPMWVDRACACHPAMKELQKKEEEAVRQRAEARKREAEARDKAKKEASEAARAAEEAAREAGGQQEPILLADDAEKRER